MATGNNHDGETLKEAVERLKYGVKRPLSRNPAARDRLGIADFLGGHSLMNVVVSYCREQPRDAGHVWVYSSSVLLFFFALAVATLAINY